MAREVNLGKRGIKFKFGTNLSEIFKWVRFGKLVVKLNL
jgi:hypothetical protein